MSDSLVNQGTPPSDAGGGDATPPASATPPAPPIKTPDEGKRFDHADPAALEGIPEKFIKDGKPDLEAWSKSYNELETKLGADKEELLEQAKADLFKDRPENADKYVAPEIEGWDKDEMSKHPMYNWFKNEAFEKGYSQEQFNDAVKAYAENQNPYDQEAEVKKLGDNARQRIGAVAHWMEQFKDDPTTYQQLDTLAYTADGIVALEKLMARGDFKPADQDAPPKDELTLEKLRSMQSDPRYWDTARRDPAFVKEVDDGYAKLYKKQ